MKPPHAFLAGATLVAVAWITSGQSNASTLDGRFVSSGGRYPAVTEVNVGAPEEVGLCGCGCGGRTSVAARNNAFHGYVKGRPMRYIVGHNPRRDLRERFMSKVAQQADGCWLWTASLRNPHGYGKIAVGRRMLLAHRVAYELFRGEVPHGMCVLHRCDVRLCVNPDHLWLGTVADNNNDAAGKGRLRPRRGEACSFSKLQEDDIRAIRLLAKEVSMAELGRRYSVSPSTIANVVAGQTWRHVS